MAFLFRKQPKSSPELVRSTKELTLKLSEDAKSNPKVRRCMGIMDGVEGGNVTDAG